MSGRVSEYKASQRGLLKDNKQNKINQSFLRQPFFATIKKTTPVGSKKIIKRSLVGVGSALTLTLGIAFAVNAMDNKEEKVESNKFAFEEWHYDGTSSDSPSDNTKYSPYDGDLCGPENETVCKLFAPAIPGSNPKRPDMTATVTLPGGQPPQTIAQRINDAVGGTSKHINETVLSLRPE